MRTLLCAAYIMMAAVTGFGQTEQFNKGKLLYNNPMSKKSQLKDWILEGKAVVEYKDGWMRMYSPNEESHHVYWCPKNFPKSFIAEWDAQNHKIDAGLCIIFFAAKGLNGESIFDSSMPKRTTGSFEDYIRGAMNDYHVSYYANGRDNPKREIANLRKNKGFHLIESKEKGIPVSSTAVHHLKLIKKDNHILMFVDDRKIIDWMDDGKQYGPVLQDGKIGFRQMQWTDFAYRNFKVWECAD